MLKEASLKELMVELKIVQQDMDELSQERDTILELLGEKCGPDMSYENFLVMVATSVNRFHAVLIHRRKLGKDESLKESLAYIESLL